MGCINRVGEAKPRNPGFTAAVILVDPRGQDIRTGQ